MRKPLILTLLLSFFSLFPYVLRAQDQPVMSMSRPRAARLSGTENWQSVISNEKWYLYIGWEYLLRIEVNPDSQTTSIVSVTSSNPNVATIEVLSHDTIFNDFSTEYHCSLALVKCIGEGSVTFEATNEDGLSAQSYSFSCETMALNSISVSAESTTIEQGQTLQLVMSYPLRAILPDFRWDSSDESVLIVSDSGMVTAVGTGSATITVTACDDSGISADIEITVVQPVVVQPEGIIITSSRDLTLLEGETAQLTATVLPENSTDKSVTWTSWDTTLVKVSETGLVTAIKGSNRGLSTSVIARTSNGIERSVTVWVKRVTISMDDYDEVMDVGLSQQLFVSLDPDTAQARVTWTSSNPEYLTVDSTGFVTAVEYGSERYTITATLDNGNSATARIRINPGTQVDDVQLTGDSSHTLFEYGQQKVIMDKGDSARVDVFLTPWQVKNKNISVVSSDENVALVKGLAADPDSATNRTHHFYVEGVSKGTTTIKVTAESVYGNPSSYINVTVNNPYYTVRFVDWDGTELYVEKIEEGQAAATPPVQLSRLDYVFSGWDRTFDCVMSDMTITAQYDIAPEVKDRNHVRIHLTEAGTLKNRLLYDTDYDRVDSLTVTGLFNGYDLLYIRSMEGLLTKLIYLDLSDIQVVNSDAVYYEQPYDYDGLGNPRAWRCYFLSDTVYDETIRTGDIFYNDIGCHRNDFCFAFSGMNLIREIRLPKFLTYYASSLFNGCSSLTKVVFAGSPESIGTYAFSGTGLKEMDIPASVKEIGNGAFTGCRSLERVTAGNVETIGEYAFQGCTALKEADFGDKVKKYGHNCFGNCALVSFHVSSSASEIPMSMLDYCSNLTEISLPESIRSIGAQAFYNCTGLRSVSMGDSVTTIGDEAFYNCEGLTDMDLSAGILELGSDVFYNNPWLNRMEYDNYVKYVGSVAYLADKEGIANDGVKSIVIKDGTTALGKGLLENCRLTSVELPSSLKSLGECSLRDNAFTTLNLPDELEIIGHSAFADCDELTSITIPEKVRFIGSTAFGGCSSLVRFTFNAENAEIYYVNDYSMQTIQLDRAVNVLPSNVVRASIGEKVKKIPSSLFNNCTNLGRFEMGASVEEIGDYAFQNCTSLNAIDLSHVKKIGDYAFVGCSLESADLSGAQEIGYNAFYRNQALTSLKVGGNIGESAFGNCSYLSELVILPTVRSIGNNAFMNCISIVAADLSSVEEIRESAFYNCYELKDVVSLANARIVDNSAFYGCALKDVDLSRADTIGSGAFMNNTSLVSAKLNGVIGSEAFYGCSSLESVEMNDDISEIGTKAFYGCYNLPVYDNVIYAGNYVVGVAAYTPDYTVREGTRWIGEEAFKGCTYMVSVSLPQSLQQIRTSAFRDCSSLVSVDIPDGVSLVGENAFNGCTSLKHVTLPGKIDQINGGVFGNCSSLDSIVIPKGVTDIGSSAFRYCSSLEYVVIPETVVSISDGAFRGCALKDIYCFAEEAPLSIATSIFVVMPFDNISETVVHVPAESIEEYRNTYPWNEFNYIVALTSDDYELGVKQVIQQDVRARKVLIDGQMIIITPDGRKFNTAGQELR